MILKKYFSNINKNYGQHKFSGISFNSNKIKKDFIFFAITGEKIDGKKFINDAIKKVQKQLFPISNLQVIKKMYCF